MLTLSEIILLKQTEHNSPPDTVWYWPSAALCIPILPYIDQVTPQLPQIPFSAKPRPKSPPPRMFVFQSFHLLPHQHCSLCIFFTTALFIYFFLSKSLPANGSLVAASPFLTLFPYELVRLVKYKHSRDVCHLSFRPLCLTVVSYREGEQN